MRSTLVPLAASMTAYVLNPKWYAARPRIVRPFDDNELIEGFMKALGKMYIEEFSKLRAQ